VDEDRSELSRRITNAFLLPYFKPSVAAAQSDVAHVMNMVKSSSVVDIPLNYQHYVLARRHSEIQVNVDATAMVQAELGPGYADQIINTGIAQFLSHAERVPLSPANLAIRIAFNPNVAAAWFTGVMGISAASPF
jgi:ABC-2 type transport system permease protein